MTDESLRAFELPMDEWTSVLRVQRRTSMTPAPPRTGQALVCSNDVSVVVVDPLRSRCIVSRVGTVRARGLARRFRGGTERGAFRVPRGAGLGHGLAWRCAVGLHR